MPRSVRRTVTALGAVASFWFALASEAYGMHACPHHDGVLVEIPAESGGTTPDGSHEGHGVRAHDDDATAPAVVGAGSGDHGGHASGVCNCVGDCAGGGGSAPLPGPVAQARILATPAPPQAVAPRRVLLPLDPPAYLHPPANAPPRS